MCAWERKWQPRLPFFGVIVCICSLTLLCVAQTSRVAGAIQGIVIDQTGSAVVGATVTLRHPATNQSRTVLSNSEGSFRAGELAVGQYEVRVASPGFSAYVNTAIVVSVG